MSPTTIDVEGWYLTPRDWALAALLGTINTCPNLRDAPGVLSWFQALHGFLLLLELIVTSFHLSVLYHLSVQEKAGLKFMYIIITFISYI